jgi:hypothetical protein
VLTSPWSSAAAVAAGPLLGSPGIICRVAERVLAHVHAVRATQKPGESIAVQAYAVELYNEELQDLSCKVAAAAVLAAEPEGGSSKSTLEGLRIAEKPVGKSGRLTTEVSDWTVAVVFLLASFTAASG